MSGVITSSSLSVTRMGGVDGCCGAASGEREGDRERAEAPSGAPLRVSIEYLGRLAIAAVHKAAALEAAAHEAAALEAAVLSRQSRARGVGGMPGAA